MRFKEIFVMLLSLMLGIVIDLIPLQGTVAFARPQMTFLILIFWIAMLPSVIGIGMSWLIGLFTDLMKGSLLGEHALIFSLIAYLVIKFQPYFRTFPIWQQALMVFLFSLLNLALGYWILGLMGSAPQNWSYWWPAITNMIIWPLVNAALMKPLLKRGVMN